MTDTNVSSLVLKKGSNRYIFDPSGNLDLSNYYTKSDIDTKLNTKANVTHSHNISDITNLQSQLNSKAASNHTHSQYATTSAVTNAQKTANNALNVANSNGFKTPYAKISRPNRGNSLTLTDNCFLKATDTVSGDQQAPRFYVDGYQIEFINTSYSTTICSFGIIAKNKTLSTSAPMFPYTIGEYVH